MRLQKRSPTEAAQQAAYTASLQDAYLRSQRGVLAHLDALRAEVERHGADLRNLAPAHVGYMEEIETDLMVLAKNLELYVRVD